MEFDVTESEHILNFVRLTSLFRDEERTVRRLRDRSCQRHSFTCLLLSTLTRTFAYRRIFSHIWNDYAPDSLKINLLSRNHIQILSSPNLPGYPY